MPIGGVRQNSNTATMGSAYRKDPMYNYAKVKNIENP